MDEIDLIRKNVKRKSKSKPFVPDEIISNILSRLSPKDAARCRLVSRRYRNVTLLRDFTELNLRNSIPTILVINPRVFSRLNLFALDMWWKSTGTKPMIHRFSSCSGKFPNTYVPLFSHAGLICIQKSLHYDALDKEIVILNPARPSYECVWLTVSKEIWGSRIYGVYFHPLLNEYCSLWKINPFHKHERTPFPYKILNFGPNPSLRTISNPVIYRDKGVIQIPLFLNNCIYWLLEFESPEAWKYNGRNDIMEFDIIKEEFIVIPCPIPQNTECTYFQTRLLNIDGILSFLLIFPNKITIWSLEDRTTHLWKTVEYTLNVEISSSACHVIAVVDGKLALQSRESKGRLLICNLVEGTVMNYQKKNYKDDVSFSSHQMSLASLSNCTSTITVGLHDKVEAT